MLDSKEMVVLVDKNDKEIGKEEKLKAHKEGMLHRAFSIFVFNSRNELLIQQRDIHKYHSGGLWSNTVCGHPRPGESYMKAAHRRLYEEMGFDCMLEKVSCFIYKASLEKDLIENEYDCVFYGRFDGEPAPNPKEVANFKWISLSALEKDMLQNRWKYSIWFPVALKKIVDIKKKGLTQK